MIPRFSSLSALCLVGILGIMLSGCAAASAFNLGLPDLGVLKVGAQRAQIEAEFGSPVSRQLVQAAATVDIYEYTTNRNPSVLRGLLNIATLGLWRYVVVEHTQTHHVRVVYDKNDRLAESRTLESYVDDAYFNQEQP